MNTFHIVFSTKYRKRLITNSIEQEIFRCCAEKATSFNANILAMNTAGDHVHLLLGVDGDNVEIQTIAKIIGAMKGSSAYKIRNEYPELRSLPSFWAGGYYLRECIDENHVKNTISYIARQKEHHHIAKKNLYICKK